MSKITQPAVRAPSPEIPAIWQIPVGKATKKPEHKAITTKPIPGFTGFIPSSRTFCSMSFGKTAEVAYDQFNHRDDKGYS
jgi:hypothetical protein